MTTPDDGQAKAASRTFRTLEEVYGTGRAALDEGALAYLEAGAGEEATVAENRVAFDRWHLLPEPLSGLTKIDTTTTFLGVPLSTPVLTGPVGTYTAFHSEGDLAVAWAAEKFGTAAIVPVLSSYSLEQTALAAPAAARFLQVLASGPAATFGTFAERAAAAGYAAICLTIDAYPRGVRDRIATTSFDLPAAAFAANYDTDAETEMALHIELGATAWSWETVRDLLADSPLPVMIKGVLTPRSAVKAVEAGAAAVMVSNVGGRQLDGAPSSLAQLPSVVAAIGGQVPIAFDSGVRRGTDVLKALALGADVVSLGRAGALGLAAGGEAGVRAVLELIQEELVTSMALCGVDRIAAVDDHLLQSANEGRAQ